MSADSVEEILGSDMKSEEDERSFSDDELSVWSEAEELFGNGDEIQGDEIQGDERLLDKNEFFIPNNNNLLFQNSEQEEIEEEEPLEIFMPNKQILLPFQEILNKKEPCFNVTNNEKVYFTHFPHNRLYEHYSLYLNYKTKNIYFNNMKITNQKDLIREIFCMFRGEESLLFKLKGIFKDEFYLIDNNICVSFLTKTTLLNFVNYFIKLASDIQRLYLKAYRGVQSIKGVMLQAYYHSIVNILSSIRKEIISLEKRNEKKEMIDCNIKELSLLSLKLLLFRIEIKVEILNNLDKQVDNILDSDLNLSDAISGIFNLLFQRLIERQYLTLHHNEEYELCYQIFLDMLQPYIKDIESWIFDGTLRDEYNEFVIQKNDRMDINENLSFWNEAYLERKAPIFLEDVIDKISIIGKSILLIRDIEQKYEISNYMNDSSYILETEKPSLLHIFNQTLKLENELEEKENQMGLFSEEDEIEEFQVVQKKVSPLVAITPLESNNPTVSNNNGFKPPILLKKRESTKSLLNDSISSIVTISSISNATTITFSPPPVGSIQYRSPPKKKRMLSLSSLNNSSKQVKEILPLYNLQSDIDLSLNSSFFKTDNSHEPSERIFELFKKKSLGDVLEGFSETKEERFLEKHSLLIENIVQHGLKQHIQQQYDRVSPYLCNLILQYCKLIDHLTALRAFFLMESGDIMDYFSRKMFELHDNYHSTRRLSTYDIKVALQESLKLGYDFPRQHSFTTNDFTNYYSCEVFKSLNLIERISIILDEKKLEQDNNFFDSISFTYDIDWPLNIIVTPNDFKIYNEVLIFNLKIKQAKQVLETMSLLRLGRNLTKAHQKFFHILMQLKHFIGTVQYYMMNRILHTLWNELCENILTATDLDQLIQYHSQYISKIKDRFLFKRAQFVKNQIVKVISLCLTLKERMDSFQQLQQEEEEQVTKEREEWFMKQLEDVENEFKKSLKMLLTILNSILMRGMHEHLEDLRSRLNFNNYYK
ncbi:hypothetical protein ABK040_008964 [Willaertia magna]